MSTPPPLSPLTTALVSDALESAGLPIATLAGLAPLRPGMHAIGPAATLAFDVDDQAPETYFDEAAAFFDALVPGSVIVIESAPVAAVWGELFSAAAKGHGAAGVVLSGATRDTRKSLALDLPIFATARLPHNVRRRLRVRCVNEPIDVLGVRVAPGDVVVADDDGGVVVPAAAAEDVLGLAADRAARESTILDELLAGGRLADVWQRHHPLWTRPRG